MGNMMNIRLYSPNPAYSTPSPTKKKGLLPGFEGVFAIAGLLAIAYVMMRQKR